MQLLQVLLADARSHPGKPWQQLRLVDDEAQQRLLSFNQQPSSSPANQCVHELFEASARQHASQPCLRGATRTISYRQVDERSNQLAHLLLARIPADSHAPVGIMLERGHELYIGLLAILKAGKCYCPLDPSYPADRLSFMAEDSGMRILLTQQKLTASTPPSKAQVTTRASRCRGPEESWHDL